MPEQPTDPTSPQAKKMQEMTEYPGPRRTNTGESVDVPNAQPDVTPGTSARGGGPTAASAAPGAATGVPAAAGDGLPPLPGPDDSAPHQAKRMKHGGEPGEDDASRKPPR